MKLASFSLSFSISQAFSAVLACVFNPQETTCQTAAGIKTFFQAGLLSCFLLPQTIS